jgi:steroid delta-isomerase-like uncharacterized protein
VKLDPKAVQRRFVEHYQSKGDERVLDEMVSEDFVDHSAPPGVPPTNEGVRQVFAMLRRALPDLRAEIHAMIGEGDLVATRKSFIGTHRAELFGRPATGKQLRIDVMDFVRIEGGRIIEHWNIVDTHGLMRQLGALDV